MVDLGRYHTAIFDCDGVILDSNTIKSDAFRQALAGEPQDCVEQFIAYHHAHGGVSRYVKFEYFYAVIRPLPEPERAPAVASALARYAALVRDALVQCACIPGVEAVLVELQARGVCCFVNSGGDQAELREVFAQRGLARYFHSILGSPATKKDNLAWLREQQLLAEPAVFLGDALSDYQAATAFGLDFIYISGRSEWKDGPDFCRAHGIEQLVSFTAPGLLSRHC